MNLTIGFNRLFIVFTTLWYSLLVVVLAYFYYDYMSSKRWAEEKFTECMAESHGPGSYSYVDTGRKLTNSMEVYELKLRDGSTVYVDKYERQIKRGKPPSEQDCQEKKISLTPSGGNTAAFVITGLAILVPGIMYGAGRSLAWVVAGFKQVK